MVLMTARFIVLASFLCLAALSQNSLFVNAAAIPRSDVTSTKLAFREQVPSFHLLHYVAHQSVPESHKGEETEKKGAKKKEEKKDKEKHHKAVRQTFLRNITTGAINPTMYDSSSNASVPSWEMVNGGDEEDATDFEEQDECPDASAEDESDASIVTVIQIHTITIIATVSGTASALSETIQDISTDNSTIVVPSTSSSASLATPSSLKVEVYAPNAFSDSKSSSQEVTFSIFTSSPDGTAHASVVIIPLALAHKTL
ncbi:uncharacterized protein BT62DRAFT_1077342, partial [Guyanagaster necrorhizus]